MLQFNSVAELLVHYLTNRFHVTVRLFSNTLLMASKCKNKKVAHDLCVECVALRWNTSITSFPVPFLDIWKGRPFLT